MKKKIELIGESTSVDIMGRIGVLTKVDTGADTSSIWVSKINMSRDNVLSFALFGGGSPFYNGKIIKRTDYEVSVVRNASGTEQIRYRTHLSIVINGRKMKALFNLSDRSNNNFPILLGKRTIRGKFIVDPSIRIARFPKISATKGLRKEMAKDPYKFHKKYIKKSDSKVL